MSTAAATTESVLAFGPDQALIGILTPAQTSARASVGCLLLNTGVNHRIGPRRLNVKTARRLAQSGIPCLRFDLSGIGDSMASSGREDYRQQQLADMRAALDAFQAATGLANFVVFGLCSGAVNALNIALADARIAGVLMFDGYIFPTKAVRLERKLRRWAALPFNYAMRRGNGTWRALQDWLRAPIDAGARARAFARLRPQAAQAAPGASGASDGPQPDIFATEAAPYSAADYGRDLQTLVDRGVDVHVMFSAMVNSADRRMGLLAQLRGHPSLARIRYRFWPDIDHTVTLLASQQKLLDAIEPWAMGVAARFQPPAVQAAVRAAPQTVMRVVPERMSASARERSSAQASGRNQALGAAVPGAVPGRRSRTAASVSGPRPL